VLAEMGVHASRTARRAEGSGTRADPRAGQDDRSADGFEDDVEKVPMTAVGAAALLGGLTGARWAMAWAGRGQNPYCG
jgi:hypothetical protein